MKTILITGMSGAGKSTVILGLQALGHYAVDLDSEAYSMWADAEPDPAYPDNEVAAGKDWIWQEARVQELLSGNNADILFVSGCASNMVPFYPYFAHIILLTAPDEVILQRLQSRDGNAYGHTPEEAGRVLRLKQSIEPLLRQAASLEIDTSLPFPDTLALILQHAGVR